MSREQYMVNCSAIHSCMYTPNIFACEVEIPKILKHLSAFDQSIPFEQFISSINVIKKQRPGMKSFHLE